MPIDFRERWEEIEQCYEFTLAYAGQGLASDEGSQVREFLHRAAQALTGLAESCKDSIAEAALEPAGTYQAFVSVLERDARDALATIELVLAQPSISSQLVDNLNASMHVRALLTDLFLMGEILTTRRQAAVSSAKE